MIKDGIESDNFSLIYDSCIMSKGYLDVIAGYARKAFDDMYVVSESAVYEPPEPEQPSSRDEEVEDVEPTEEIEDSQEKTEDTQEEKNKTEESDA